MAARRSASSCAAALPRSIRKGLTVLAEVAVPVAELNAGLLAQQIKDAEEDVADAQDDETRRRAQENLDHLQALQGALV